MRCTDRTGVNAMGMKLYVGNLGFDVTDKELEDVFTEVGTCDSAAVVTARGTAQRPGYLPLRRPRRRRRLERRFRVLRDVAHRRAEGETAARRRGHQGSGDPGE